MPALTPDPGPSSAAEVQHAVRFQSVEKRFGALRVLDDVSLTVRHGEVLGVLGPSGGGKSTLLRLINGLEVRTGGDLRVLDVDVPRDGEAADPGSAFWVPLRRRIGFVFQAFHLYPHRTALQNVTLAPVHTYGWTVDKAEARAHELLARVGVADKAHVHPAKLSGGQQQRVAIARALMMQPEILLFDEPTSALDPEMTAEVLDVMRDLAERHDRTLVVVTHEFAFAREAADRVAFLAQGRVLEVGPTEQVLLSPEHPRTRAFFERVGS